MTENNKKKKVTSRVKQHKTSYFFVVFFILFLITAGVFFFSTINQKSVDTSLDDKSPTSNEQDSNKSLFGEVSKQINKIKGNILQKDGQPISSSTNDLNSSDPTLTKNGTETQVVKTELDKKYDQSFFNNTDPTDETPSSGQGIFSTRTAGANQPTQHIKTIDAFFAHLDEQTYMQDFKLPTDSKIYFPALIQKLLDNPPIVTRETDDLFTLLKNTAHFFRILGKRNTLILKGILDRERSSLESVLHAFYTLSKFPNEMKNEYNISYSPDTLFDYSGFFLNTMGGRLYLFRRDSSSRMVVSYYATMMLDKGYKEGNNPHGIDLLPVIDSLIEELENGGNNLEFKQQYLENLYSLSEYYNQTLE